MRRSEPVPDVIEYLNAGSKGWCVWHDVDGYLETNLGDADAARETAEEFAADYRANGQPVVVRPGLNQWDLPDDGGDAWAR